MHRRQFLRHSAALASAPVLGVAAAHASVHALTGRALAKPLSVNGDRLNGWLAQFDAIGRPVHRGGE